MHSLVMTKWDFQYILNWLKCFKPCINTCFMVPSYLWWLGEVSSSFWNQHKWKRRCFYLETLYNAHRAFYPHSSSDGLSISPVKETPHSVWAICSTAWSIKKNCPIFMWSLMCRSFCPLFLSYCSAPQNRAQSILFSPSLQTLVRSSQSSVLKAG